MADDDLRTGFGPAPLSTHLYEFDLLGRFFRTYYIGSGISVVLGEEEPDGNLKLLCPNSKETGHTVLTLDRQTGAVLNAKPLSKQNTADMPESFIQNITREDLDALCQETPEAFQKTKQLMAQIPFSTVGWLKAPELYMGASIQTAEAADLDRMAKQYGMRFAISGDTFLITTAGNRIHEILFTKTDRIYQLDLSAATPFDEKYSDHTYTLAVPFTEMYSGTYSVIVRFADGGQEVLANNLTLSRTRK